MVAANRLDVELLDPNSIDLMRLFKRPGADWDPPPPAYRNLRADPPPGHKSDYAVLYTADSIHAVAMECRVVSVDAEDRHSWSYSKAQDTQVARYTFDSPALFMPLDARNRQVLFAGSTPTIGSYLRYQQIALQLFQRFGTVLHGYSWESFHRGQPGRVYAIWHHHKSTINLRKTSVSSLDSDADWLTLVTGPSMERVD